MHFFKNELFLKSNSFDEQEKKERNEEGEEGAGRKAHKTVLSVLGFWLESFCVFSIGGDSQLDWMKRHENHCDSSRKFDFEI